MKLGGALGSLFISCFYSAADEIPAQQGLLSYWLYLWDTGYPGCIPEISELIIFSPFETGISFTQLYAVAYTGRSVTFKLL